MAEVVSGTKDTCRIKEHSVLLRFRKWARRLHHRRQTECSLIFREDV